jgi:hypothetical protein
MDLGTKKVLTLDRLITTPLITTGLVAFVVQKTSLSQSPGTTDICPENGGLR